MSTHAADPKRSDRLRKVLDFLISRGHEGATTREIVKSCDVCAVNAIVHELRHNGYLISCKQGVVGGARVARYRIEAAVGGPEKVTA